MRTPLFLLAGCSLFLTGCGIGSPNCTLTTLLTVGPSTATADHAATAPGNQQQFSAEIAPATQSGCPIPEWVAKALPTWTNPDPLEISISSAQDDTNGLATCLATTNGAVTLTATVGTGSTAQTKTVSLTCK
jgi:hypothetical protein